MRQIELTILLILTIPIGIVIGRLLHKGAPGAIKRLRKPHNWPKIIMITVCVIVALTLIDIVTPVWGGQVRFYAKWSDCGRLPIQGDQTYKGPKFYKKAAVFDAFRDNRIEYFCSPKEAEMQWYSSDQNSASYPNLTAKDIELREKNRADD